MSHDHHLQRTNSTAAVAAATPSAPNTTTTAQGAAASESSGQNEIDNNQRLDTGSCDMMTAQYSALYNKSVLFWPCPSMKVSRHIFAYISRAHMPPTPIVVFAPTLSPLLKCHIQPNKALCLGLMSLVLCSLKVNIWLIAGACYIVRLLVWEMLRGICRRAHSLTRLTLLGS